MSYIGSYYGSLGGGDTGVWYVIIQRGESKGSHRSGGLGNDKKKVGEPVKKGPYTKAQATGVERTVKAAKAQWNSKRKVWEGVFSVKKEGTYSSDATVATPAPGGRGGPAVVDTAVLARTTQDQPAGPTGPAGPSTPSPGAPAQETETENVAMTEQGPAPATPSGRPAVPAVEGFPVSTALMIGGGLLALYFMFGRKRS